MVRIPDATVFDNAPFPRLIDMETAIGVRKDDMRPAVLEYAMNIHRQRLALLAEFGMTSLEELWRHIENDIDAFISVDANVQKATRITELTRIIDDILEQPKDYELPLQETFNEREVEMRELFGR